MDENVWRDYVKEDYNGAFVLWIDQSTDPLLAAHNSNGVCFAMALLIKWGSLVPVYLLTTYGMLF